MNRMEEYQALMEELERPVPELETTLDRAERKKRKRDRRILRPVAGVAACFVIFVLLVNFCAPVAYACSLVPGLRELAEAVTFSRSLTDAVENEYVQPISLTQTENEITASVEYLIVDQKQVNIFFRLDSDVYTGLEMSPRVFDAQGDSLGCSILSNNFDAENGELRSITVDFVDENVPDSMILGLEVCSNTQLYEVGIAAVDQALSEENIFADDPEEPEYLAEFQFLLEFDPEFTASGRIYPVDQTVELDGQQITITDIQVYPTHLRVNVAEDEDNTAWLVGLDFYIETDWGMKFDTVSSGITATGTTESPSMISYRADSTYFYQADHLKLVITEAQWLDKDRDTVYLNLVTGETGQLPDGVEFLSAQRQGSDWIVSFKVEYGDDEVMGQVFDYDFYDAEGTAYEINMRSTVVWNEEFGEPNEDGTWDYYVEQFPLKNYSDEEVWLSLIYTDKWTAENEIVVTVQ